ncbi:unnamed protein product [Lepidochelys olivacea]
MGAVALIGARSMLGLRGSWEGKFSLVGLVPLSIRAKGGGSISPLGLLKRDIPGLLLQCVRLLWSLRLPLPTRDTCAVCRVQTGERPYQGAACGKRFNHSSTLAALRRIHTGERPYCCGQGGESSPTAPCWPSTRAPMPACPPFPCAWCSKSFASCPVLATHQRVRTGECPFHCTDCGKSFWGSSSLAEHRRLHTGERPFCCPQCPKAYTSSSILAKHLRSTHAGPAVRGGLHLPGSPDQASHGTEAPNRCPDCGHELSSRMALAKHRHGHTGVLPYQCGGVWQSLQPERGAGGAHTVALSVPTDSALAQSCAPTCSPTPGTSPTFVVPAGGPLPAVPTWLGAGTPASGPAAALTMARASTTAWC